MQGTTVCTDALKGMERLRTLAKLNENLKKFTIFTFKLNYQKE
jgi:hypothetical protein